MKKKDKAAVSLGRRGGLATLKKHGKKQLKEWGKLGGKPKKTPVDKPPLR